MPDPFYITTAISYPNGRPHIGHAYEAIAADVIARFQRMEGRDVRLQTGTDEHGLKMARKAQETGQTTRALADEMSGHFKAMCDGLDISYDRFIRTVDPDHHRASQALWSSMAANGDLYLDRYEGWYSVRDEAFYDEGELIASEDGTHLSPNHTPVEWTVEESWFFRLSRYQDRLLQLFEDHPDFLQPESRRNEMIAFVAGGLRDLSISRTSFDWGVPVPGSDGHVMYVWVDALTNYLTGVGYPDGGEQWKKYWPASLHLIGKDIVRFHAVYWPAFLMSAGLELPKKIFGHGFLLNRGQKESKSLGNVTDPLALAGRFGVDNLRYYLMRDVGFGQDGSYSAEAIVLRTNAELANSFGNLAQRILSIIFKNCDGRLEANIAASAEDEKLEKEVLDQISELRAAFHDLAFSEGLASWMKAVFACNQFVDDMAPWALKKTDPDRMIAVLMVLFRCIRHLAIGVRPVVPGSADALLDQMGIAPDEREYAALDDPHWFRELARDFRVTQPRGVFPRLELPEAEEA
ncbi:methionine--tRNA ligase [Pseudopontixanthobacter vadosimaris]|uniref:methionine--tRNA ligase n=1 Tax=Pseudopontixanthobacter vadosimaris TaxID=2726450 RepID=UPI00147554E9|nr:methionine--tRNA ligase [Pseudopontixanthobacter vadosimaris]